MPEIDWLSFAEWILLSLGVPTSRLRPSVGNLRQRAIRAAHRVLEEQGVDGLNLRAIAADMGTGVGSLYYHFANKGGAAGRDGGGRLS
jgi:AcrR family transcriptional regulator